MIPVDLVGLVSKQTGNFLRNNPIEVDSVLDSLGVSLDSEFADFYRRYKVSTFHSRTSNVELLDILSPSQQVSRATTFIHEVWELPNEWVCFSSTEGEGGFLYSTKTGEVFDFDLATRDEFLKGNSRAGWNGFFDFMTWYLS